MPVPYIVHRAEAKYNVTTEFPHLGLHEAAATGNLGLAEYALSHGQPVNSVLDGVLPLHAACSFGDDLVVRLLIEHGADVNALRLPRKYSQDRHRDHVSPIIGTSGSTPLHFAAANGHYEVIRTLLFNGANPNRPDKHGITPEMLAAQNDHMAAAELLHEWSVQKDRDLVERDLSIPASPVKLTFSDSQGDVNECPAGKKRLQMKRSIDTALHLLKKGSGASCSNLPDALHQSALHLGHSQDSTLLNTPSSASVSARSPSFDHYERDRRVKASPTRYRRPQSAGTDAPDGHHKPHRLGSKYSLLGLFHKASNPNLDPDVAASVPVSPASPAVKPPDSTPPGDMDLPPHEPSSPLSHRRPINRRQTSEESPSRRPSFATGRFGRDRSLSRDVPTSVDSTPPPSSPAVRPGILRGHYRSASGGHSPSPRTLRFDSSTSSIVQRSESGKKIVTSPVSSVELQEPVDPQDSTKIFVDARENLDDDDIEEYGEPISADGHVAQLRAENNGRMRGFSITSSMSSLSPIVSPGTEILQAENDFPFSIHQPPPDAITDGRLDVPGHRGRGDSLSSISTNTDGSAPRPLTNDTTESPIEDVPGGMPMTPLTPVPPSLYPPQVASSSPEPPSPTGLHATSLDLRSISSHAEAEAALQRAKDNIFQLGNAASDSGAKLDAIPLSARLAAFGEIMALERQLKEKEDRERRTEEIGSSRASSESRHARTRVDSPEITLRPVPTSRERVQAREQYERRREEGRLRLESLKVEQARQASSATPASPSSITKQQSMGEIAKRSPPKGRVPKRPSTANSATSPGFERPSIGQSRSSSFESRARVRLPKRPSTASSISAAYNDISSQPLQSTSSSNFVVIDSPHVDYASSALSPALLTPSLHDSPKRSVSDNHDLSANDLGALQSQPKQMSAALRRVLSANQIDMTSSDSDRESISPGDRDKARQQASVKKLSRMGFQATETYSRSPSAGAGGNASPSSKSRFGIRNLVQTFKGKA